VDGAVEIAVLPQQSAGFLGTPGLVGSRAGQDFSTAFAVRAHDVLATPDGTQRLTVRAGDDAARLGLTLVLELTAQGLVRQQAVLTNEADEVFGVDALLLTLPVPGAATELLDFSGRWARERSPQRTAFTHGTRLRENRRGRTGYDSAFVLVAGTAGFAHRTGEVWGLHTAWSGNHRMLAERSHYHSGLLGGGELLESGEVRLARGESYTSPWVYGSWGVGLDALAGRFHAWLRARPQHPSTPRPVTLNTWEAVYFQHDLGRLTALADAGAAVGAERFVLDDGWFGDRRDDTKALGDWYVSADVWPDGLHPLVEHVVGLGLEFGLWVEPEMVNADSDLARAHPDWILRVPSRLPRRRGTSRCSTSRCPRRTRTSSSGSTPCSPSTRSGTSSGTTTAIWSTPATGEPLACTARRSPSTGSSTSSGPCTPGSRSSRARRAAPAWTSRSCSAPTGSGPATASTRTSASRSSGGRTC
jgi:alpha-galactosidase